MGNLGDEAIFSVEVTTTSKNRDYWQHRQGAAVGLLGADIVIVPWQNFRADGDVVFPQGTVDFFRSLQEKTKLNVAVASSPDTYREVALHARIWRWPTLLVTAVLVPVVVNLISDKISEQLSASAPADTIEMELIIEGPQGKCVSLRYKGPVSRAVETIVTESKRCLPLVEE